VCGIAGIVDLDGLSEPDKLSVSEMVRVVRHRGPDDQGTYGDGAAVLGHARLSIIDLSAAGRQPMANEDETVWITFNGEIYNFLELRAELIAKGHRFRTRTDTETIIHLYEEEGDRCVERLRGMFAFGIWDVSRQRLFLARDRLGIKPLYYGLHRGKLIFGSEIKSLLQVPDWPRDIDHQALLDFLTFSWIPTPKSIFRSIRKLPPGYVAVFGTGGFRVRQYWDFDDADQLDLPEDELCEQLRERLAEAVRLRLIADVPVGAFLSGGVDSSAVVATMARLCSAPVVTNSIGFDEQAYNELDHADYVASLFRTEHHRQVVRPDAADVLATLAWHWDEPFADASAIPTYYVSKMARENVTVALSGDGGDENLAGYRLYKFAQRERAVRRFVPSIVRRSLFGSLGRVYPKADWLPRTFRAKSTLLELAGSDLNAIYLSRATLAPQISRGLLHGDLQSLLGDYDPLSVIEYHYRRSAMRDPLHRQLYVDIKTYLVDDILTKVDRASMAVALEVRVPLLDHRLVEFMACIPSRYKLRGGRGKYLLKQAFRPILGGRIVDRGKMGFSIPLNHWLREPLRATAEESLFSTNARIRDWLDMHQFRRQWKMLQTGLHHRESLIWTVLMLEQWAQRFSSSAAPLPAGTCTPSVPCSLRRSTSRVS
jgi:asparagine synthase (glutamine-hydrolysing)